MTDIRKLFEDVKNAIKELELKEYTLIHKKAAEDKNADILSQLIDQYETSKFIFADFGEFCDRHDELMKYLHE